MGFAERIRKGKVTFVKDIGNQLREITDAGILANQIDLELKGLDQDVQMLIEDSIQAQTKNGVDVGRMKEFVEKWDDMVERGVKGFDSDSQMFAAFTTLKNQYDQLKDVFKKDALNGGLQKEWLQKIGRTASQIGVLCDLAQEQSHELALYEMKLAERIRSVQKLI